MLALQCPMCRNCNTAVVAIRDVIYRGRRDLLHYYGECQVCDTQFRCTVKEAVHLRHIAAEHYEADDEYYPMPGIRDTV